MTAPAHSSVFTHPPESLAFRKAVAITAEEFEVSDAALLGRRRPDHLAAARHALWWAVQSVFGYSLARIAACMGVDRAENCREHGSVSFGICRAKERQSIDPGYKARCGRLADRLRVEVQLVPDVPRRDAALLALVQNEGRARKLVESTETKLRGLVGPLCPAFDPKCPVCRAWTGLRMLETALLEDPARLSALRTGKSEIGDRKS